MIRKIVLGGLIGILSVFAQQWNIREWDGGKELLKPLNASQLLIPVAFPKRLEIVSKDKWNWQEATHLELAFQLPKDFPEEARLTVFTKDGDHLWREVRRTFPPADEKGHSIVRIPIQGRQAVAAWRPQGHCRTWTPLVLNHLQEIGFILEVELNQREYTGEVALLAAKPVQREVPKETREAKDIQCVPMEPMVGRSMEISFRLDAWPRAPFDSEKCIIWGEFTRPDGSVEKVRGFYYEDFLYHSEEWDKTKCLVPYGEPMYKVRYCPRMPGKHTLKLSCSLDGNAFHVPEMNFMVAENGLYHGVVRRDKKAESFLAYEDGTFFWGLGMNVRSPFDNRYKGVAPYSSWQDRGLSLYDKLFKAYRKAGINVVEVWMCSWWLALEWINDAPGFHGVGHYNPYRAWMLDYIVHLAEENGIFLILVINNHGKFGMAFDSEWARNPYNVKNGGYLQKCEDYYTNERARNDTKKLLDYIVARWGSSPSLLCWKLFTELDLTGPDISYYQRSNAPALWYSEMGKYVKSIDIYGHPVTTHWMLSYHRINDGIANLPELDFLTTDDYYDLASGTDGMLSLLYGSMKFARSHHKPLIITEFGGSSYADNMTNLVKQVPLGLWTGFFNEFGILPMYWWFALVEDKSLYGEYSSISRFGATEDRRGMTVNRSDLGEFCLQTLWSDTRVLAWLFDKAYFLDKRENNVALSRSGVTVDLPAPKPGSYTVEFWDATQGTVISSERLTVKPEQSRCQLQLPTFKKHIALKVKETK